MEEFAAALTKLEDIISAAEHARSRFRHEVWWRGQARDEWSLRSGLHRRTDWQSYETYATLDFARRAPTRHPKTPASGDRAEWLFLMQHYGLPTRLLDWTRSVLVAAFFAAARDHDDAAGVIWALDPWALNHQMLGHLAIVHPRNDVAAPYFDAAFQGQPPSPDRVLAIDAIEVDARMLVQQSCFTVHGTDSPIDDLAPAAVARYIIPPRCRRPIRDQLEAVGVSRAALFPDLANLAADLAARDTRDPA